jgi:hypothetical protein
MISLLPLLLRNWMLIALVAAIGAVPAAYKAGKWRQANLDAAAWKIENARLTSEAYAAADRVSREVIEKPAPGQVRPACPPPVVRSCNDFAPDELDELRRKYPRGPLRRAPARHPQ